MGEIMYLCAKFSSLIYETGIHRKVAVVEDMVS